MLKYDESSVYKVWDKTKIIKIKDVVFDKE